MYYSGVRLLCVVVDVLEGGCCYVWMYWRATATSGGMLLRLVVGVDPCTHHVDMRRRWRVGRVFKVKFLMRCSRGDGVEECNKEENSESCTDS